MGRSLYKFFDRLEDFVRGTLAHRPIIYSFIGGAALVLFWRGVWHLADWVSELMGLSFLESSLVSVGIAAAVLLVTGLFVSEFVGEKIIMSGLSAEKRLSKKTEAEVAAERPILAALLEKLEKIEEDLDELKQHARRR